MVLGLRKRLMAVVRAEKRSQVPKETSRFSSKFCFLEAEWPVSRSVRMAKKAPRARRR